MIRAVSLFLSLPSIVVALIAANVSGAISLVETLLGFVAIISFAVLATGWTEDHDVPD